MASSKITIVLECRNMRSLHRFYSLEAFVDVDIRAAAISTWIYDMYEAYH